MHEKITPKLFIETTVFNFCFDGKQGKKQQAAIALFDKIKAYEYEAYSSEAVLEELMCTSGKKLDKMLELWQSMKDVFLVDASSVMLADRYVGQGIIPLKYANDARHIATATVRGMNFVVSYNFGHIIKLKTLIGTAFCNLRAGYAPIGLTTPMEVIEYDR
ncbi:MAG: hypothetical protein LBR23_05015 [Spirochaetaceae bacterium]|jgi:predicted nucleic acid-binding protein|nr:hypothetical protein [Spirochaetaceae bacterium]